MIGEIAPPLIIIVVLVFLVRIGGAPSVNSKSVNEGKKSEKGFSFTFMSFSAKKEKPPEEKKDKNPLKSFVAAHDICHLEHLWCTKRNERKQHETICECFLEKLCREYHQSHSKKRKRRFKDENTADKAQMLAYTNIEGDIKDCLADHLFTPEMVIQRLQAGK